MTDRAKRKLLIAQIREGNLERLETLLQHFCLYNSLTESEVFILLSEAIENKRVEIAKFIVQQILTFDNKRQLCIMFHSTIVERDDSKSFFTEIPMMETNFNLLESIVLNGDLKLLEMLLDKGINVNPSCGNHPLHIATENNKATLVELLLNPGANVNVRNNENMTPLHVATIKGHFIIAEKLLNKGANVNSTIYHTKSNSDEKLHSIGEGINKKINETFFKAAKKIADEVHEVSKEDKVKFVYGKAKPNFDGTSIFFAIKNLDVKMTKLLLSRGANVKKNPNLFGAAIDSGNLDIIESFLKQNVDINTKNEFGETALHRAILVSHSEDTKAEIAKLLIRKGASVQSRNRSGQTPLHLAAQKGYAKLVEALLNFDPNEDLPGNSEDNLREFSISERSVSSLKNKAAQLCAKNTIGETALHLASSRNHQAVIEILLKLGININSKTIFGKTALDVAFENGCRQAFLSLLNYGSDINVAFAPNITKRSSTSFCVITCDRGEFITSNSFCVESIRKHIVRLKTAGRFVSEGNLRCLDDMDETLSSYHRECEEEIEKMKNMKIRNVPLYNVLQKSVNQLAIYAKNKRIDRYLESKDFEEKFPIYSNMIRYNFKRCEVRDTLLNISTNLFSFTIEYALPLEIVITDIFRYLENEDLENLIEACRFQESQIPILVF